MAVCSLEMDLSLLLLGPDVFPEMFVGMFL